MSDKTITLIIDAKNLASAQLKGLQRDLKGVSDEGARTDAVMRRGGQAARGVLALGFGAAAVGASQLSEVQAQLQADTGASADEAHRMAQAVNAIAGESRQSLPAVAAAMAKVHTDLGLAGDAADAAARSFVDFARVSGQEAAGAVTAFDDILDAWKLKASDAGRIMDQLTWSHQKFGGAVSESEAALSAMAPAMQAANMSVDDGIALLNLFNASGVDAASSAGMLNRAVKSLKPGQDLNDLIAQIGAISDPTARAQEAIRLFGRQGAAMANAIKPGMTSLSDFAANMDEARGASQRAADALDSSFPAQVQKAMSEGAAAVRGFGDVFGPALMGAMGAASLWTTISGSMGISLSGALKGAWARMATDPGVLASAAAAGEAEGAATAVGAASGFGTRALALAAAGAFAIPVAFVVGNANDQSQGAQREAQDAADAIASGSVPAMQALQEKLRAIVANGPFMHGVEYGRAVQGLNAIQQAIGAASSAAGATWDRGWEAATSGEPPRMAQLGNESGTAYAQGIRSASAMIRAVWKDALDGRVRAANDADQLIVNHAEIAAQRKILADSKATAAEKAQARIRIRDLQAQDAAITAEMTALNAKAEGWAEKLTANYARGLYHGRKLVVTAAGVVAQDVKDHFQVRSPAKRGPLSESSPEDMGSRLVGLYARGMASQAGAVSAAASLVASGALLGPGGPPAGTGSLSGSPAGAGSASGGLAVHLHVTTMAAPTRAQVADMADALDDEFRRRYARFSAYAPRP